MVLSQNILVAIVDNLTLTGRKVSESVQTMRQIMCNIENVLNCVINNDGKL